MQPVEDVVLQMKSMNIDNVVNFPFPTRPSLEALTSAEKKLTILGALDDSKIKNARYSELNKLEFSSRLTPLGKSMSNFPVSARCSKMIVLSPPDVLQHVIALVSALTVREMFLKGGKWQDLKKKLVGHGESKLLGDYMLMIGAICKSDVSFCSTKSCSDLGLRTKAMLEIHKLREQLLKEGKKNFEFDVGELTLTKPTSPQVKILRQLLLSSFCDHVARKIPDGYVVKKDPNDPNRTIKKKLKHAYESMETDKPVFICPESVLRGEHPDFVIYRELYRGEKKMYMRDVAVIDPKWLSHYAFKLCQVSDNLDKSTSQPRYDPALDQMICSREVSYGPLNWPLGCIEVPMHLLDDQIELFKHFALALLSGQVIPEFRKYADKLLSPPSLMVKPWSKLQSRTSKILQALISQDVKSKKDLARVWEIDPEFLKFEFKAWLPESQHQKVNQDWAQMISIN